MLDFKNSIHAQKLDSGLMADFWGAASKNKVLVPFTGNNQVTGHSYLKVIQSLCKESDSFTASLRFLQGMVFGGRAGSVSIVEKQETGLASQEEQKRLNDNEAKAFLSELKNIGLTVPTIISEYSKAYRNLEETGNGYLRIRVAIVDDSVKASVKSIHYLHAAYRHTKPYAQRKIAISENWTGSNGKTEWEEVNATRYGEDYAWTKRGDVYETVLHIVNEIDEGGWYGKPWVSSVFPWMQVENNVGEWAAVVNQKPFTSQKIVALKREYIEVEFCGKCDEGTKEDGTVCGCTKQETAGQSRARVLREITTMEGAKKGKSKTLAVIEYDEEPPTIIDLEVNRDTAWFNANLEKAEAKIHKVMKVPRELAFASQTKSGIGSNVLADLYIIANEITVTPLQVEWENIISDMFSNIGGLIENDEISKHGFKFPDRITPIVEALSNRKNGTTNSVGTD